MSGRVCELPPAFRLEEELKNLYVPPGFCDVPSPGVEAVLAQQDAVAPRMLRQHRTQRGRESCVVLRIFKDRNPLAVFVSRDAGQPFEHFVAFKNEASLGSPAIREQGAPDGMRVQYGASAKLSYGYQMQTRLSRWVSVAMQHRGVAVDFENAGRRKRALVEAARCDGEAQRRIGDFRAEIAACTEDPSAAIEFAANCAERCGGFLH